MLALDGFVSARRLELFDGGSFLAIYEIDTTSRPPRTRCRVHEERQHVHPQGVQMDPTGLHCGSSARCASSAEAELAPSEISRYRSEELLRPAPRREPCRRVVTEPDDPCGEVGDTGVPVLLEPCEYGGLVTTAIVSPTSSASPYSSSRT